MIQTRGKAKNDVISVSIFNKDVIDDRFLRDNHNVLGFNRDLKYDDVNKITLIIIF